MYHPYTSSLAACHGMGVVGNIWICKAVQQTTDTSEITWSLIMTAVGHAAMHLQSAVCA